MSQRPQTILVIEDDITTIRTLYDSLKPVGYRLLGARRAVEGLDIARRERPDMVLTSIYLPDMTGRELAVMLRSDTRFIKTPIVALSDNNATEERALSLAVGMTGFIDKPIDAVTIVEHIQYFMQGGQEGNFKNTQELETVRMTYLRDVVSRLEKRIRELEENNKELTAVDQIKDDFIRLAAHELRTPLTLITGYNKLLQDYPIFQGLVEQDHNASTFLEGLTESIDRMQSIVEEILTASRIITNRIDINVRDMDLGAIVQEVLDEFVFVVRERRLQIHFLRKDWPRIIYADPDLMRLTIRNLVSNAIKYTPDGGHIYLNCAFNGEIVQFSVRDTGIGIARDKQIGIFKRMQQINNVQLHSTSKTAFDGGGLGLGLSICHGIIDAHHGKIWVESEGQDRRALPGSEFFVEIPVEQPEMPKRRLHALMAQ